MLSLKRLWAPAQAALDADTKFVEKGTWNAWIRKDVSKKFLKGLSHEYLSQHGLAFEDNGDPNTYEWTAKDEMQRTCKVTFVADRNHVLVKVDFEDEEEISLWQKFGELLAERSLLRSQTETLPGGAVRFNEIKDSCLYVAEDCLFVAYLGSTAPREGIRKVCVQMVESRGMKVTEARSSTIVAAMGRVVCTMTVGFNKRRQRLLRVNYTVGFWSGDWRAFFYDMYMDLGIELARAQFLAAMHIKRNENASSSAGTSTSLSSSASAPSILSSSSSATSIDPSAHDSEGDSPFPGIPLHTETKPPQWMRRSSEAAPLYVEAALDSKKGKEKVQDEDEATKAEMKTEEQKIQEKKDNVLDGRSETETETSTKQLDIGNNGVISGVAPTGGDGGGPVKLLVNGDNTEHSLSALSSTQAVGGGSPTEDAKLKENDVHGGGKAKLALGLANGEVEPGIEHDHGDGTTTPTIEDKTEPVAQNEGQTDLKAAKGEVRVV